MPPTMMVETAVATPAPDPTTARRRTRPALSSAGCAATALSDANANANANASAGAAAPTRPKAKAVASRYLISPSAKPTCVSKSPAPRALPASADRSRPAQPNAVPTDAAVASGTATTRTLAVAFQTPAYSLETTTARARSASASSLAEGAPASPEPKRSTSTSTVRAKVSDASQNTYRWPASSSSSASAPPPPCGSALAHKNSERSTASSRKETQTIAAIFGAVRPPSAAFRGTPRRASVDGASEYLLLAALSSDTDSASSGGSGSGDGAAPRRSEVGSAPPPQRPSPRSLLSSSSARFTRSDRFAYPGTPSPSRASAASPAPAPVKKRSLFTGLLSSPFSSRSSLKQQQQPSPSKPGGSLFSRTACASPARRSTEVPASAGKVLGKASSTGCAADGDTKFKLPAAIRAEEEHQLRLLHTKELQWRLVNAEARAALSSQTMRAETNLCGAWISILRMRKSVAIRKMQLQLLRNNCKLMEILRGHMKYLEEWSFLERDCAQSLSGTTQALTATVLRLPVSNGAMADIQGIRNALSSAVDVMYTIGNSTRNQLPKLARTNLLVSQLSRVFIQEHILIAQCRDLLSSLASMHVRYSSLQGQRIQLNQRRRQYFQKSSGYLLHHPTQMQAAAVISKKC